MSALPQDTHARFEELANLVGPAMLRFAQRRVDRDTAEDVVSEALLVLWRRLDDVPPDAPTAWAIGVTRWWR